MINGLNASSITEKINEKETTTIIPFINRYWSYQ